MRDPALLLATLAAVSSCKGPTREASPVVTRADAATPTLAEVAQPDAAPVYAPDAALDDAAPEAAANAPESTMDAGERSLYLRALARSEKDAWMASCLERSAELDCGSLQQCRESVGQVRAAVYCKSQVNGFMSCLTKTKRSGWKCDESGAPALRESVCVRERADLSACLFQSGGKL
jgi:hypothetical protein